MSPILQVYHKFNHHKVQTLYHKLGKNGMERLKKFEFCSNFVNLYCKFLILSSLLHLTGFVSYHKSILVSRKRIDVSGSNITQAVLHSKKEKKTVQTDASNEKIY